MKSGFGGQRPQRFFKVTGGPCGTSTHTILIIGRTCPITAPRNFCIAPRRPSCTLPTSTHTTSLPPVEDLGEGWRHPHFI